MNKLLIVMLLAIPSFAFADDIGRAIGMATVNPYASIGAQQAYINQQDAIGSLLNFFINGNVPTKQEIQNTNNNRPQITTFTDANGHTVTQACYRMQNANAWHCEVQ